MANTNIDILKAVSYSQGDYTQTVAQNKRQFFKDIVDTRFLNATDIESIQEQTAIGSNLYQAVDVRIMRAIASGLSENFANEVRKIVFQDYTHEQYLGKQYIYNNSTWLTVNMNITTGASSHSIIRMCNNTLKWVNPQNTEEVFEWECVFTKQFTNTGIDEGNKGVPQVSGDFYVLVQQNAITQTIDFNQRFILNGHAFQVSQINPHLSSTYMTLKLFETQIQPTDDLDNGIASANTLPPSNSEAKILPQNVYLYQGNSQEYNVYNYINGSANADTFTFTASQAPQTSYTFTAINGNNFIVANLAQTTIPLIIRCTNANVPTQTIEIQITLGGLW